MMTKPGSLLLRLPAYAESSDRAFSVSVLVPVYNERHVVETRPRHVLALKHELIRSLQVIVVDDGSTDDSWEVLQRLAAEDNRIVLRRLDRHHGARDAAA